MPEYDKNKARAAKKAESIYLMQEEIDDQFIRAINNEPELDLYYEQIPKAEEICSGLEQFLQSDDGSEEIKGTGGISAVISPIISLGASGNLIHDEHGNWRLLVTLGVGGGLGMKTELPVTALDFLKNAAGIGISGQVINGADSFDDLAGWGASVGGTLVFASAELGGSPNVKTFSSGLSGGLEFHAHITYSFVFSLPDYIEEGLNALKIWKESLFSHG